MAPAKIFKNRTERIKIVETIHDTSKSLHQLLAGKPGADAVITGDMVHSPLQARYPELGMMSDYDSAQAGVSRRELFGRFCDTSTLMCTAHFPSPSTARVVRWKDAFDLIDV